VGVKIQVGRATVQGQEGKSDLLVSKEPLRVDVPVAVESRQARLVTLALQGSATGEQGFAFIPRFVAAAPRNTVVPLTGYCTSTATANVTVFDKVRGGVVGMFPTGAEPKGIAIDGQTRAYVALSGSDEVQVLDLATGAEVGRVALRPGDRPRDVAITPDGKVLLVTNPGSRTTSFVDANALVETSRVSTGEEPVALLMDRGGQRALVFNYWSSNITVIDIASRAVVKVVPTDAQPSNGQFDRAGTRLYVLHGYSPYLTVYSVPDFVVMNRFLVGAGARSIQVDPRTDMVYVGSDDPGLRVFNPTTFAQFGTVNLPGAVSWMTVDPVSNTLYALMPIVRAVAGVNLTSLAPVSRADVGEGVYAVWVVDGR
jgi:YVTN family beta-propeller protein